MNDYRTIISVTQFVDVSIYAESEDEALEILFEQDPKTLVNNKTLQTNIVFVRSKGCSIGENPRTPDFCFSKENIGCQKNYSTKDIGGNDGKREYCSYYYDNE